MALKSFTERTADIRCQTFSTLLKPFSRNLLTRFDSRSLIWCDANAAWMIAGSEERTLPLPV